MVKDGSTIGKKQLLQREQLWPGAEPWLWHRKANKGFATIPKTMPLILQIMDDLSNGKPLSATYLGLWCETWDNSMVNVSKHQEMAHAAGFTGQRAVYTWSGRMQLLQSLNFIDIKPGRSGAISHVILWNPHRVIRFHHEKKTPGLVEANYNALLERAIDIGANDMIDQVVVPPPALVPPTPSPPLSTTPSAMVLPPQPIAPAPPAMPTTLEELGNMNTDNLTSRS
ncbi:hypothetical protein FHT72_006403 [Rhizobium sp. BK077]|uniref:hypothetical protein n=1 Tax=unclassified Rhizobium TaxID=2613769 RepID=UPI00161D0E64|nr:MULTISPECIES: hypothetical protein [unclassified Rhizobium]MBB3302978.1 hypothetical protein [Rhizobium sp. BK112]MBB3371871.1 hypothetical protein [Rhizobium sp. BK077]MBB4182838.1 hypothetical protein [Rhizobium sp. BK109]